jgi:hypothetical protein
VNADPAFWSINLVKIDLTNGFYRVWVDLCDIPKLGVAFPSLMAKSRWLPPLALPMSWVSFPPYFCSATETVAGIADRVLHHGITAPHRLDDIVDTLPLPEPTTTTPTPTRAPRQPVHSDASIYSLTTTSE